MGPWVLNRRRWYKTGTDEAPGFQLDAAILPLDVSADGRDYHSLHGSTVATDGRIDSRRRTVWGHDTSTVPASAGQVSTARSPTVKGCTSALPAFGRATLTVPSGLGPTRMQ